MESEAKVDPFTDRFRLLKDPDGNPLLDEEGAYNIGALLGDPTTDRAELYAQFSAKYPRFGSHWSNIFYSETANYAIERNKRYLEYELLQNKASPPADAAMCPRCGFANVVQGENKRAADEGGVSFVECKVCSLRWAPE
jgi:DNA-directed RNA polymerase subunit M/transcription elongation factor TFIIS